MARSRHCDSCGKWHDLGEPWPQACFGHFRKGESNSKSLQVMGDIQPYKNTIDGKVIGGRKQHRDFLRAHGMVEVGNENVPQVYQPPPNPRHDIIDAMKQTGYWRE